ncbi:MAG: cofactor-independent phosphoglycerate mutase [Methanobacteriota archaeon]|nr:MAG: cofactor-independent phosphoglycerate mutase [Euryarchaeota archaeon]
MKYVILLGDGMADYPLDELGGKTPLEAARTPNMDAIARRGVGGLLQTIPEGMGAGSDVANLSILGYDPKRYYTGRGPLEAANIGVELKDGEVAFRCNFITVGDGKIEDYSAGHISSEESEELIKALNSRFSLGRFYAGVSYRNLFVTHMGARLLATPPHDALGRRVDEVLLKPESSPEAAQLNQIMLESRSLLEAHPVNRRRLEEGKNPANMIWLWGQGSAPSMEPFREKHGVSAAVISAVDLIKGIGRYAGMKVVDVPGATGLLDTNWEGKAEAALKALEDVDLVYVHVEAVDEASHAGDAEQKVAAIEEFDRRLVGRLLDRIDFPCRIALLPDHYTPVDMRTHSRDPVPFIISPWAEGGDGLASYSEKAIKEKGSLGVREGHLFMEVFLSGDSTSSAL